MKNVKESIEKHHHKITVAGVGGAGNAIVDAMIEAGVPGVQFVCMNTDKERLLRSKAPLKIQMGKSLKKRLGAGADPEIGEKVMLESYDAVADILKGTEMLIIVCGMGGGTGTGGVPVLARWAKEAGIFTLGVITKPFTFEGKRRGQIADERIENFQKHVDAFVLISCQRTLPLIKTPLKKPDFFFKSLDEIVVSCVRGITELITIPGKAARMDMNDMRDIMKDGACFTIGIGTARGEERAVRAARDAVSFLLLDFPLNKAKTIFFNVTGGRDMEVHDIHQVAEIIAQVSDPDAKIFFGSAVDETSSDEVWVVIYVAREKIGKSG